MSLQQERRFGKIFIEDFIICNESPEVLKRLFSHLIIVRAEQLYLRRGIEYCAICAEFDPLGEAEKVPEYEVIIHPEKVEFLRK